jgi:hypothetical protein
VVQRSYEIGGLGFGVRTNSEACATWLDETLAGYAIDEELDPYYSIWLAPSDGVGKPFHILYVESRAVTKTYDLKMLGRAFLAQLESLAYYSRDDALYANAGVVASNGRTALVPGVMIEFIATLSRRQRARSGVVFPLGTSVALELGTGRALPLPQTLDIPADTLDRLARVAPAADDDEPLLLEPPAAIDAVCSLQAVPEPVRAVSPAAALYRLGSHAVNLHLLRGQGLETLRAVVERARCYEIASSNKPQDMLAALTTTLEA